MIKGKFYFLSDEYCDKFSRHGVMSNKETTSDGLHRRPCFYAVQDINDENIYWMIPIFSQIEKYRKLLEEKLKRYRVYDGLEFGYVQGREAAFLLQNICPVTEKYIVEKYIDEHTGKDVSIPNDLMRKIDAKAKKVMNKYYQGTKIVITDLDYIFEHL
ncbi:MAG: hypothetical protein HDR13_11940 [Lachnospiraceae bacterium]|nr:hypothetical protein [Lachnospiraceae bacterium]